MSLEGARRALCAITVMAALASCYDNPDEPGGGGLPPGGRAPRIHQEQKPICLPCYDSHLVCTDPVAPPPATLPAGSTPGDPAPKPIGAHPLGPPGQVCHWSPCEWVGSGTNITCAVAPEGSKTCDFSLAPAQCDPRICYPDPNDLTPGGLGRDPVTIWGPAPLPSVSLECQRAGLSSSSWEQKCDRDATNPHKFMQTALRAFEGLQFNSFCLAAGVRCQDGRICNVRNNGTFCVECNADGKCVAVTADENDGAETEPIDDVDEEEEGEDQGSETTGEQDPCDPEQKIADKYGLDLDGPWNREKLPHLGRHPDAYHEWVFKGMERAAAEAGPSSTRFLELFERYVRVPVRNNPGMLRGDFWR